MSGEVLVSVKNIKGGIEYSNCGQYFDMTGSIHYHSNDKEHLTKWFEQVLKNDGWLINAGGPVNPYVPEYDSEGKPYSYVYYIKRHIHCEGDRSYKLPLNPLEKLSLNLLRHSKES